MPCGIYETDTLKHSAQTCLAMLNKLQDLKDIADLNQQQQLTRLVMHKEDHAQKCKEQIYILWSDYFKADHYQQHPNLQQTLWLAAKQCSAVKQGVEPSVGEALVDLVKKIDEFFEAVKG